MAVLPTIVSNAWDDREGPVVLTTVDGTGVANSIYASCTSKFSEDKLVEVDNFLAKTKANILVGSKGDLLFITKKGKAYQVKGSIDYVKDGAIFEDMKTWLNPKLPGHAAAVVNVEEVYCGADKLL